MAGASHRVVGGSLGSFARFKESRVRWQLSPVGIPSVFFGAEDLVDADDDVVAVHPLASVDPEHRRICHARRTAIGRNSIESAGSGLSETDQTMRDLPCSSGNGWGGVRLRAKVTACGPLTFNVVKKRW